MKETCSTGPVKRFATTCEYCGVSLKIPLDKCNRGAQHHHTCRMVADKLRGIMQHDIYSAMDDCVELGMTADQMRHVIRVIIAKTLTTKRTGKRSADRVPRLVSPGRWHRKGEYENDRMPMQPLSGSLQTQSGVVQAWGGRKSRETERDESP